MSHFRGRKFDSLTSLMSEFYKVRKAEANDDRRVIPLVGGINDRYMEKSGVYVETVIVCIKPYV